MTTKISDLDKNSQTIVNRWFTIRSLSKSTQEPYLCYFSDFVKYTQRSVYELYEKAKEEEKNGVNENDRELTWFIIDYKHHIEEMGYAHNTVNLKLNVIFSFCRSFDFPIPKFRIKKALCEDKNYERPLKKEEILQMMNVSPLRESAFIIIQAHSGMGSKEVRSLTIQQIVDVVNNELDTDYKSIQEIVDDKSKILSHDIYEITIIRSKINYRYTTYINNETMDHILRYISWRMKQNNNKGLKNTFNELLFITNKGEPMTQKAVTAMYREIGNRCGFESQSNTYRYWRSHNIRKFFFNIVEETVGEEYAHEWLGHKSDSVTRAYSRRKYRSRKAYEKCIPHLRIEPQSREELVEKIRNLELELKRIKELK